MPHTQFFVFVVLSYLSGSLPTGYLLTKRFLKYDIREIGSGNIGATNVLRSGRKDIAAATLVIDALKGFIPVFAVNHYFHLNVLTALCGIAAVLGHCFPVWLRFKGGKGVATGLGVLAAFDWLTALIVCAVWLIVAKVGKISSLSALIGFLCAPCLALWRFGFDPITEATFLIALVIWLRHVDNIKRMLNGAELSAVKRATKQDD